MAVPVVAVQCVMTRVRNISGHNRTYAYLPHNGKTLLSGEEHWFPGSIFEIVAKNQRFHDSLMADLQAGKIAVHQTPTPHYWDERDDTVRILKIDDQTVLVDDPCHGHYISSGAVEDI